MKKFCSYVLELIFKLNKLLISDTADSADKNVIKYVFYEDCKVYDEDNKDNKDNEEDSEDINCRESS